MLSAGAATCTMQLDKRQMQLSTGGALASFREYTPPSALAGGEQGAALLAHAAAVVAGELGEGPSSRERRVHATRPSHRSRSLQR